MHLIAVSEILVSDKRTRKLFSEEKLQELADSIHKIGLLHLPVARMENGRYHLCAGERRLRAINLLYSQGKTFQYFGQTIPTGQLPFMSFDELSPVEALEVEIEENTVRLDLTWQERAVAIAALHHLRTSQNPQHTMSDTAAEVYGNTTGHGSSPFARVGWKLQLAKHLEVMPDVAKATSEADAIKILRRNLENQFRAKLAEQPLPKSRHQLIVGDAITALKSMERGEYDVILTDPPYGLNAQNFDAGMTVTHDYSDDWTHVRELLKKFGELAYEHAKDSAHLYMFCAIEHFSEIKDMFWLMGWQVWPRPIIWVKDVGHTPRIDHGPAYYYETILFAAKGGKYVQQKAIDVIIEPAVKGKEHAAQKPVAVYTNLLARSLIKGTGNVLDPFAGSGTIFAAANTFGCTATGIEADPAAAGIAQMRLDRTE